MPISTIRRGKTFIRELKPSTGNSLAVFLFQDFNFIQDLPKDYKLISYTRYLNNLRAFAKINSLPDSSVAQYALVKDNNQPRKQLNLYISSIRSSDKVASTSLFKSQSQACDLLSLLTNNSTFELELDHDLFIQFEDVGHGLLSGSDIVTVYATCIEEFTILSPDATYILVQQTPSSSTNSSIDNTSSIDNSFFVRN